MISLSEYAIVFTERNTITHSERSERKAVNMRLKAKEYNGEYYYSLKDIYNDIINELKYGEYFRYISLRHNGKEIAELNTFEELEKYVKPQVWCDKYFWGGIEDKIIINIVDLI